MLFISFKTAASPKIYYIFSTTPLIHIWQNQLQRSPPRFSTTKDSSHTAFEFPTLQSVFAPKGWKNSFLPYPSKSQLSTQQQQESQLLIDFVLDIWLLIIPCHIFLNPRSAKKKISLQQYNTPRRSENFSNPAAQSHLPMIDEAHLSHTTSPQCQLLQRQHLRDKSLHPDHPCLVYNT